MLRNGNSQLKTIALVEEDFPALTAFLQSLNEDYEKPIAPSKAFHTELYQLEDSELSLSPRWVIHRGLVFDYFILQEASIPSTARIAKNKKSPQAIHRQELSLKKIRPGSSLFPIRFSPIFIILVTWFSLNVPNIFYLHADFKTLREVGPISGKRLESMDD
jgi:hypothetical protein